MILSNQVRCLRCNDTPYSGFRHDFVWCGCHSIAVDGGMDYLRRVGNGPYEDMSITIPNKLCAELTESLEQSRDRHHTDLGVICALFRVLRDTDEEWKI